MNSRFFLLALTAVALTACGDNEFGQGVRRPETVLASRPALLPLAITEVNVAGSEPFVEILNTGSGQSTLTGFAIATPAGITAIADGTVLAADAYLAIPVAGSLLSRTSGEAAVVDGNSVVHAYASWGSDPGLLSSQLLADAFADGAPLSAALPVPFPIAAEDSLVFEGTPGCGTATPGAAPGAVAACDAGSGDLVLTEFLPSVVDVVPAPEEGEEAEVPGPTTVPWLELLNRSETELDLNGVRVCTGVACVAVQGATGPLPPGDRAIVIVDQTLAAIESLTGVEVGAAEGLDCGGSRVCAIAPLGTLTGDVELSVARPGESTGQGDALLSYARFAGATEDVEAAAVESGLWTAGSVESEIEHPM
ncbi:MAG: hypothetical protein AAFX94_01980, partial [Myxococcota bacterium]